MPQLIAYSAFNRWALLSSMPYFLAFTTDGLFVVVYDPSPFPSYSQRVWNGFLLQNPFD